MKIYGEDRYLLDGNVKPTKPGALVNLEIMLLRQFTKHKSESHVNFYAKEWITRYFVRRFFFLSKEDILKVFMNRLYRRIGRTKKY